MITDAKKLLSFIRFNGIKVFMSDVHELIKLTQLVNDKKINEISFDYECLSYEQSTIHFDWDNSNFNLNNLFISEYYGISDDNIKKLSQKERISLLYDRVDIMEKEEKLNNLLFFEYQKYVSNSSQ